MTTSIWCFAVSGRPEYRNNRKLLEQIICDADLSHLGMDIYWDRNSRLRQEFR
ncbi:MAG: hypothetical protein IPH12_18110 [Saprospirales bacterium]|nr:hypothetical protein [Saprospirales bacterium]